MLATRPTQRCRAVAFRAFIQETDVSPKFLIDMPSRLLTVRDDAGQVRLEFGQISGGNRMRIRRSGGEAIFEAPTVFSDTDLDLGSIGIGRGTDGYFPAGGPSPGAFDGRYTVVTKNGIVFVETAVNTTRTYALDVESPATANARLRVRGGAQSLKQWLFDDLAVKRGDGSTNLADMATIVVSTLAPSGDYPERTLWAKV